MEKTRNPCVPKPATCVYDETRRSAEERSPGIQARPSCNRTYYCYTKCAVCVCTTTVRARFALWPATVYTYNTRIHILLLLFMSREISAFTRIVRKVRLRRYYYVPLVVASGLVGPSRRTHAPHRWTAFRPSLSPRRRQKKRRFPSTVVIIMRSADRKCVTISRPKEMRSSRQWREAWRWREGDQHHGLTFLYGEFVACFLAVSRDSDNWLFHLETRIPPVRLPSGPEKLSPWSCELLDEWF